MSLNLLVLEDSELDAELMLRELRDFDEELNFKIVDSKEAFGEALQNWNPDLIISDYNLKTFNGDEALDMAKAVYPDVPFITLSGSITKDMELTLLEKRANDVLTKDNLQRLPYAIKRVLAEKKDRDNLKHTNHQLNAILEEKELLVAELHHRVKNNLALISSFMQLDKFLNDQHDNPFINANILRIKLVAIIHEVIYQGGSYSDIRLANIIPDIITESLRMMDDSECVVESISDQDCISVNINQAVPVSLLVGQMLNEVYILAKKEDEHPLKLNNIKVKCDQDGNLARLYFYNDRLCHYLQELKAQEVTRFSEITEALARQIHAELFIDEKEGYSYIEFQVKDVKGSGSARI